MKTEIQIFKNEQFEQFGEIRTMVDEKGEPWFVGKDVARRLGYINHRKALRDHVDEEDRKDGVTIRDSIGRDQEATFINESGLYSLVLASKLPQAKAFKRWVTAEVLPQIRKTGGYIPLKDKEGRELSDLEIMCRAMMIMKKSIEQKEQLIADLHLTTRLLQDGIIYLQSNQYMLYAPYARRGLAATRTHTHRDLFGTVHTHTYLVWTEKGKKFIHEIISKK